MSNRARKKQTILPEAARLFWQKGYQGTTIENLADALGMNKAMLYYYFPDKQAILYEVIIRPVGCLLPKARATLRLETSAKKKLELLIRNHVDFCCAEQAITGTAVTERKNLTQPFLKKYVAKRDQYEALFRRIISEGIDAGEFRQVDVQLASLFILGMLNSILNWYKTDGRCSNEDIIAWVIDFIFTGLRNQE